MIKFRTSSSSSALTSYRNRARYKTRGRAMTGPSPMVRATVSFRVKYSVSARVMVRVRI
jgi:hypothetical protein